MHTKYEDSEKDHLEECLYDCIVYTDGGYSRKHDVGAFAFVMIDEQENVILRKSWAVKQETNNRCELKAILAALHLLPQNVTKVCVCSDSQYALKTLAGVWGRNANEDLFAWYEKYNKEHADLDVTFRWVRGHNGNKWNELCDAMCNTSAGIDLNAEYAKYTKHK